MNFDRDVKVKNAQSTLLKCELLDVNVNEGP